MNFSPHIPELPPAAYLAQMYDSNLPAGAGIDQAIAYLLLDMPEEALDTLAARQEHYADTAQTVALGLAAIELGGLAPAAKIAQAAKAALQRHGWNYQLFEMGMIHYLDARMPDAALALWNQYHSSFWCEQHEFMKPAGQPLQQVACAASGVGKFDEALAWIVKAAADHPHPADLLMDHDLRDVWCFYSQIKPTLEEARLLMSEGIRRILKETEAGRILKTICHTAIESSVPPAVKPWMRRTLSSHYHLRPDCPADICADYFAWLDESRTRKIAQLRAAIDSARSILASAHAHTP